MRINIICPQCGNTVNNIMNSIDDPFTVLFIHHITDLFGEHDVNICHIALQNACAATTPQKALP